MYKGYHPYAVHRDPGNHCLNDKLNVKIDASTYELAYKYLLRWQSEIDNHPNEGLKYILDQILNDAKIPMQNKIK